MINREVENVNSLSDVLDMLVQKVKLDINVATLAYYQDTKETFTEETGYSLLRVKPFPLNEGQDEYSIYVYDFTNNTYTTNQRLFIVFCDRNFIQNLALTNNQIIPSTDSLHQLKYGVVVPFGASGIVTQITIPANTTFPYTASVSGISATDNLLVSPTPATMSEAIACSCYMNKQLNGQVKFTGTQTTQNQIIFNITKI